MNDAPVATGGSYTIPEDSALGGVITATDVDGDILTYNLGNLPDHGTVFVNPANGIYQYEPDDNWNGIDTFTVIISDGNGGTATATVTITVTPVNDAPVATGDSRTTDEDTPVSGGVTATDVDGDTLTYTVVSGPNQGTLTSFNTATGAYTYAPDANYYGPDEFNVTVSDGNGGSVTVIVYITVNSVNDAPVAPDYTRTVDEDTPLNDVVVGTDVDTGDTLTYSAVAGPTHGNLVLGTNGIYSYTPFANWFGTDYFEYLVTDALGLTDQGRVDITVNSVNDAPTVPNYDMTTPEDTQVSGTIVGSDVDGDSLTYELNTLPINGVVTVNADGSWTYTPNADWHGTDSFTVAVSDGIASAAISTVTIIVTPVNDAPVANDDTATGDEDGNSIIDVKGNDSDVDGDTLNVTDVSDPAHGTVIINADGTVTYTPEANWYGTDSFTYTISDVNGGTELVQLQ